MFLQLFISTKKKEINILLHWQSLLFEPPCFVPGCFDRRVFSARIFLAPLKTIQSEHALPPAVGAQQNGEVDAVGEEAHHDDQRASVLPRGTEENRQQAHGDDGTDVVNDVQQHADLHPFHVGPLPVEDFFVQHFERLERYQGAVHEIQLAEQVSAVRRGFYQNVYFVSNVDEAAVAQKIDRRQKNRSVNAHSAF